MAEELRKTFRSDLLCSLVEVTPERTVIGMAVDPMLDLAAGECGSL